MKLPNVFELFDTVNYQIPNNFTVELFNKDEINSIDEYFVCRQRIITNSNSDSLQIISYLELKKTEIEPNNVHFFYESLKKINSTINQSLVLKKKE
jgi:hypothetical protein